jgi:MoaA/NifB/PqqE/SkfB family radical SAM enzyme
MLNTKRNTTIITGTGEPLQNKKYLQLFSTINKSLPNPFLWIEMQTSGVMLDDKNLDFLKNEIEVNTISLSLANMFDNKSNSDICGISPLLKFQIEDLCKKIKSFNFNLRLSLNMINAYNDYSVEEILDRAKNLGADQITFRKLYYSNEKNKINSWIEDNKMCKDKHIDIVNFLSEKADALEILPFGYVKYSYNEMGIVVDDDCMSKETKDTYKYLILREDCHLYSKWNDKGSLIF